MRTRGGGSVFLHIYVWSPSIHMDPVWQTVKDFAKKVLKQNEEECFFQEFNPADLQGVIDKQQKLIESLKERGARTLPNILIVLDDIADNEQIARRGAAASALLPRASCQNQHPDRHAKYRALAPQIRMQALSFCAFKLRSQPELAALLDEVSALGGRKLVDSYYREATKKPYSFLYIRLDQPEPQFLERFDFVLEP